MAGEHAATGALLRAWCQVSAPFRSPTGERTIFRACPDGSLTSGRPAPDHRVAMISTPSRLACAHAGRRSPLVGRPRSSPSLGLVATGCQTPIEGTDDDREPVTLVVSDTWVRSHQARRRGAPARARRASRDAVDRLRDGDPHRLDRPPGRRHRLPRRALRRLLARQPERRSSTSTAPALFGVDSATLRFDDADTETVPNVTTTRATQALGDGAGPGRLAGLHRPRQPAEHRRRSASPASAAGSSRG